jgi:hypothetical protein
MRPRAHLGCAVVSLNLRLVFLECRFINLPSQNGRVINRLGVGHQHVYLSCQVLRNDATAIREWRELRFATIESISKRFPSRTFPVQQKKTHGAIKAQNLAPAGWAASARTKLCPDVARSGFCSAMAGNAWIFKLEPEGQELMNAAASVKTPRTPRGVSKAAGIGVTFEAPRMKV